MCVYGGGGGAAGREMGERKLDIVVKPSQYHYKKESQNIFQELGVGE